MAVPPPMTRKRTQRRRKPRERGPNGGRLLADGDFTLELAIFESRRAAGIPCVGNGRRAGARTRGRRTDRGARPPRRHRGPHRVRAAERVLARHRPSHEPHSFDVTVVARHGGREHRFEYESYEGRTTIAADVARAAGIATATAGPGTIRDELVLYGAIAPDATRVRAVHARFPGVIRSVSRNVGDAVRAGETLATIESNESLQTYSVTTPINGIVTARHAAPGEQTDAEALFEIADFSSVWAELDVFSRDRARLRAGLEVAIGSDNGAAAVGSIGYLAPAGNRASQSVTARVVLDNADGRWTPGQFVEGRVTVGATPVALAVPLVVTAAIPRVRRRVRASRRDLRGAHARRSAGVTRASSRCSTASRRARPTSSTTAI